jgi:hypothetical protein
VKHCIVGSRKYDDRAQVDEFVSRLPAGTVVIVGGAPGVDTWAEIAARWQRFEVLVRRADWGRYGPSAGFKRNAEMVAECDTLTAFWNGESRGTAHSVRLAAFARKLNHVYAPGDALILPA